MTSHAIAAAYVGRYLGGPPMSPADAALLQVEGIPTALNGALLGGYTCLHRLAEAPGVAHSLLVANALSHSALRQGAVTAIQNPHVAQFAKSRHAVCAMLVEVGNAAGATSVQLALQASTIERSIAALACFHLDSVCRCLVNKHGHWDDAIEAHLLHRCALAAPVLMDSLKSPSSATVSIDVVVARLGEQARAVLRSLALLCQPPLSAVVEAKLPSSLLEDIDTIVTFLRARGFSVVELQCFLLMGLANDATESRDVDVATKCMTRCEEALLLNGDTTPPPITGLLTLVWLQCWLVQYDAGCFPTKPPNDVLSRLLPACSLLVQCLTTTTTSGTNVMAAAAGVSPIPQSEKTCLREAVNAAEVSLRGALAALAQPSLPHHVLIGVRCHVAELLGVKISAVMASAEGALASRRLVTAASRLKSAQQLLLLYDQHGLHKEGARRSVLRGRLHALTATLMSHYVLTPTPTWNAYDSLVVGLTHIGAAMSCYALNAPGLLDARLLRCELIIHYCESRRSGETPLRYIFRDTRIGADVLVPWGGPIYGCSSTCASAVGVASKDLEGVGSHGRDADVSLQEAFLSDLEWVLSNSPLSPHLAPDAGVSREIPPSGLSGFIQFHLANVWLQLSVNDDPAACAPPLFCCLRLLASAANNGTSTLSSQTAPSLLLPVLRAVDATISKLEHFALLGAFEGVPMAINSDGNVAGILANLVDSAHTPMSLMHRLSQKMSDEHRSSIIAWLLECVSTIGGSPKPTQPEPHHQEGDESIRFVTGFLPCSNADYRRLWWQ